MSKADRYLYPAARVIQKLALVCDGADEDWLHRGAEAASKATGVTYTGVFKWMRPKSAGGRDGFIPAKHHIPILEYARKHGVDLEPADFFVRPSEPKPALVECSAD